MTYLNRKTPGSTFAGLTLVGSQRTSVLIPVLLLLMMLIAGLVIQSTVDRAIKQVVGDQLATIRDSSAGAVQLWFSKQESECRHVAKLCRQQAVDFTERSSSRAISPRLLESDEDYQQLQSLLDESFRDSQFVGWVLQSVAGVVLAAWDESLVGRTGFPLPSDALNRVFSGSATVSTAFRSPVPMQQDDGKLQPGRAVMAVMVPINNGNGRCVGVLAGLLLPEVEFTSVLNAARSGESGETFAFNREAMMISGYRFEKELRTLGLLPQDETVTSILNVSLRNPEADLRSGKRSNKPMEELPFTEMAIDATRGGTDINAQGYVDMRGVRVIGAWRWLTDYGIGIATEMEVDEAYRPMRMLKWSNVGLMLILAISCGLIALTTMRASRAERKATKEHRIAKKLGQYRLDEILGVGGMGTVYKAQHALLMRPVAIKVLDTKGSDAQGLHRFQREVELTSQLNNPHTIAVYDYGQTQNGDFYYVMEFLDGLDLSELVRHYGDLPVSRVIAILLQICGSLIEAHGRGLIHRDIKPGNIMLTERGGVFDFAKLLDFGLVKESSPESANMTHEGSLTGTPMYMSPEAIRNPKTVDPRSDIYSIGAVGYFLVTGKPLFDAAGTLDAILNQVQEEPQTPSERAGKSVSHPFEQVIMLCLCKRPEQRPQSVDILVEMLRACPDAEKWTQQDARQWWKEVYTGSRRQSTILSGQDTIVPSYGDDEQALDERLTGSDPISDEL
ncbi:MAG: serine/threonine protein kinase [Pirellulaceae bacterium]